MMDYAERTQAQKRQTWAYLVTHNYMLLYKVHPITDLGEDRYRDLLQSYYKDGVGHIDTARAIHATEVVQTPG